MANEKKRKNEKEEFKINCIYAENGKNLNAVVQQAFKSFCESRVES